MSIRNALRLVVLLAATTPAGAGIAQDMSRAPIVRHTGTAPTGYEVTFRLSAPEARKVEIKGEWFFARPSALKPFSGTEQQPVVEGQAILPKDWKAGDFPLPSPNATAPNFPVIAMTKGSDGLWTFTTPLPSGVFTYSYIVDCDSDDRSKCIPQADPANKPWGGNAGEAAARVRSSQIYVPSDPAFATIDMSWQAPALAHGKLVHSSYAQPAQGEPVDKNNLVIYMPPGYDPKRAEPYPTLYLGHGGGGNEMDWTTQGAMADIIDNLIVTGQVAPLVVVMPNAGAFSAPDQHRTFTDAVVTQIVPYVEVRYNVGKGPSDRAFSGLSMGGMMTNAMMMNHPDAFGYYGVMSAGLPPAYETLTPEQVRSLAHAVIWIGGGWQDVIHAAGFRDFHYGPKREIATFAKAGFAVRSDFVNGGHQWSVWRVLLRDFLTQAAFLPKI